jgi:hypothetical protein
MSKNKFEIGDLVMFAKRGTSWDGSEHPYHYGMIKSFHYVEWGSSNRQRRFRSIVLCSTGLIIEGIKHSELILLEKGKTNDEIKIEKKT